MNPKSLLIVDDDEVFREVLADALTRRRFDVTVTGTLADARRCIETARPANAIIDLRIGNDSGLELVELLGAEPRSTRTVVLTGYGSIATAVEAIKLGAVQYLTKPAEVEAIIAALDSDTADATKPPPEQPFSVRRLEWEHIQKVLAQHNGNVSATARALGMHRRTLQRKLQKRPVRR